MSLVLSIYLSQISWQDFFQGGANTLIGTAVSDSGCGGAAGGKGLFTQISGISFYIWFFKFYFECLNHLNDIVVGVWYNI